ILKRRSKESYFSASSFANRIKWVAISLLFLGFYITSCKKFVAIDLPDTLLSAQSVFNDNGTATSAMTYIYSYMYSQKFSYNFSGLTTGLMSDELKCNSSTNVYYLNNLVSTAGIFPWSDAYNFIYKSNAVIEGLALSTGVSEAVKSQLTGEAKFIRAFCHFYLVNCYGDVPLVTSTDYQVNSKIARSPTTDVYRQIITDLKDAETLLNSDYVDFYNATGTSERTRPTKWAAKALMARAYLYMGKNDSAELKATEVINNTDKYGLLPNLNTVFVANSGEAIWQLQPPGPNTSVSTVDGSNFVLTGAPTGDKPFCSPQLLDSFETGDQRRINWVHDTIFGGQPYSYPHKYKQGFIYSSSKPLEYTMVFRLAEQYLIRAEARAKQNNLSGAKSDLNAIRHRAGLADYAGANTQTAILDAILHERQVELFTEWGHRWFDLIRTGKIDEVMNVVAPLKGGTWDDFDKLFPIPLTEIQNDPNLTQNPGYH
ncbi:MAG TPA: RagB/SusD family nutrient uptake outer membrane protein, partial [Niabella sp.]